ncbi:glutathione S-transferase family protein [Oceanicoccus sagamiensis]|uniref:Glutathione S-transferase n=1 Tax=Oceanicoccus sagamiensis TaxID=716816 RepID=A0A1X9NC51_9GAMM|nr:glutathione S-transferase family protein [Oceanicoccus sagamiensis]ARN75176.1 glutathione S-transferase [Oceanicoccus sagamiensis]
MITLHGASASPFVRKVLAVLAIKQLPFEQTQQMPFGKDAEFEKISPLGKIPALQDGDFSVADSAVICAYLEDAYGEIKVFPTRPQDKARARWLENLADNTVAGLAAGIFFQRFMRPMAFKEQPDEALVEKIISTKLPPHLDYIESQLPAQGFIFGDTIMLADIALVSPFINASYAGYIPDAERWPLFSALIASVKAHPAIAPLLETEAAMFGFNK